MKKLIRFLGILCLVSSVIIGCKGTSEEPANLQTTADEHNNTNQESNKHLEEQTDKKKDEEHKEPAIHDLSRQEWIDKNIITYDKNFIEASNAFAETYIKERYKDYKVTVNNIEPNNGYSLWELSDSVEGSKFNCLVSFTSDIPIEGLEKSSNTGYSEEIIVLMIKKDNEIYLSGYLDKADYDESHQQEFLYSYFKEDARFQNAIEDYSSSEIIEVNLSSLADNLIISHEKMVTNDTLAIICKEKSTDSDDTYSMVIKFYNMKDHTIKTIPIEDCTISYIYNVKVENSQLIIESQLNETSKKTVVSLDESYRTNELERIEKKYAFAKKYYVYTKDGSIYYNDGHSDNSILLLEGINSSGDDRDYYFPFKWVDESRFVYGRGGYEWSNGCGIYDIKEMKDYPLDYMNNLSPMALNGSTFFTIEGEMGPMSAPYVTDLNNDYKTEPLFSKDETIPGYEIVNFDVAPDGNTMVFLICQSDISQIMLWSINESKIIKTYTINASINDPSHVRFIDNNNLEVLGTKTWACDNYIHLIPLEIMEEDITENSDEDQLDTSVIYKLNINNISSDEQTRLPNRLLRSINEYAVNNNVEITSHDFINEEVKDSSTIQLSSKDLKQTTIKVEKVVMPLLDTYINIQSPKLVKDGILFLVQDIWDSNCYYFVKSDFDADNLELLYTLDVSNYLYFNLDDYRVRIKTTDKTITYLIYSDVIIYDIENNTITDHIRYSSTITDDVYDLSSDGQLIAFINSDGNLIISDIDMQNPKLIVKAYHNSDDEREGSMPRYPYFSLSNPNLLSFRLQGYEWSYGDMLYNVIDGTLSKVANPSKYDAYTQWASGDLLIASDMYENYLQGFTIIENDFITIDKYLQLIHYEVDYGPATHTIGIPFYDENRQPIFIDLNNQQFVQIEGLQLYKEYFSISTDGQYLIVRSDDRTNFELYKIIYE